MQFPFDIKDIRNHLLERALPARVRVRVRRRALPQNGPDFTVQVFADRGGVECCGRRVYIEADCFLGGTWLANGLAAAHGVATNERLSRRLVLFTLDLSPKLAEDMFEWDTLLDALFDTGVAHDRAQAELLRITGTNHGEQRVVWVPGESTGVVQV